MTSTDTSSAAPEHQHRVLYRSHGTDVVFSDDVSAESAERTVRKYTALSAHPWWAESRVVGPWETGETVSAVVTVDNVDGTLDAAYAGRLVSDDEVTVSYEWVNPDRLAASSMVELRRTVTRNARYAHHRVILWESVDARFPLAAIPGHVRDLTEIALAATPPRR